ncbi:MAG: serine/threonine-protein kinase [Acidobacteriota bacterium]
MVEEKRRRSLALPTAGLIVFRHRSRVEDMNHPIRGERWMDVEAVFERAARAPVGERRAFLDQICGADGELRREVESLLAADRAAGAFLDKPLAAEMDLTVVEPRTRRRAIGPYEILRPIGEGGMGTVYLAVRADDEYRQEVAIKIFGYGHWRRDLKRRFRTERQILASLEHPNIARLLDGGTTDHGEPYLVMEHIEGEPIDFYCDRQRLTVGERIDLFRQLCAAVRYAHQNLVVHRDIKPSNVLVTASGLPKLLDFGIAQLVDAEGFPQTLARTSTGQRLMTPRYASPEQVRGEPVSTATDVYSLGVLLYELLIGCLPYRVDPSRLEALEHAVLEVLPERLSVALIRSQTGAQANGKGPAEIARARRSRPEPLRRQLVGDLETIVAKALRKELARRYGSIDPFDEDLRRYREGLPVLARPDTFGYRTGKFLRRHSWSMTVAAVFVALLAGSAVTLSMQRDQARSERDKARAVVTVLEDTFAGVDPSQTRGASITAREVLDLGAERVQRELAEQPEVSAGLAATIGNVYRNLGLLQEAEPLLRLSLKTRQEIYGEAHPVVAESLVNLGLLRQAQADFAGAESLFRRVLELRRNGPEEALAEALDHLGLALLMGTELAESQALLREAVRRRQALYGVDHPAVAESLQHLGRAQIVLGQLDAAREAFDESLRIVRQHYGDVHPKLASGLLYLANAGRLAGDLDAAVSHYTEALRIALHLYGEEHPEVAEILNNLAIVHSDLGNLEQAEDLLRQGLAMRRQLLGEDHAATGNSLHNLGWLLVEKGDLQAAGDLLQQALEIYHQAFGAEHSMVASLLAVLGDVREKLGDLGAAEALYREAADIRRRSLGENHSEYGLSLLGLGSVLCNRGRHQEALPQFRRALRILESALGEGHPHVGAARNILGASLGHVDRAGEGEPLLLAGYGELVQALPPGHYRQVRALRRMVEFYEAVNRSEQAAHYRALLPE